MNAKHLALAAMAALFSCRVASAKTVHFNDCEITDWPTLGLAAADTAQLNANTTAYVNDMASLLVVSNLTQVTLNGSETSKIVFNVPEGETWGVGCYIRSGNQIHAAGYLVKRGKGTLKIKAPRDETGPYNCNITVEEGIFDASTMHTASTAKNTYMGVIAVSNGATFYAPGNAAQTGPMNWHVRGFAGDGTITNLGPATVAVDLASAQGNSWTWDGKTYDFGGDFRGSFTFAASRMRQFFSGTNSTFTSFSPKGDDGTYSAGEGTFGVMKFGNSGEPSSIGSGSYIRWIGGGGFLYLGDGETTDKELQFQEGGHPFIDGGAHGGLVFTTALEGGVKAGHADYDKTLTLMGSNTTACALSGIVPAWSSSAHTFHIVKKGSGTWRLDYPASTMTGKITVEEGLLGFSQLLEKGTASSFGLASGEAAAEAAITLGTEETEGGIGLISPTNWNSVSTTRPISLAGNGRIVNNSTNFLGIGMISVATSLGAKLSLDGSGTNSVAYGLQDGAGVLSVAKDGDGTWYLAGSNSFTGTLEVHKGTLVLSNPENPRYTWYKFAVKELMGESSTLLHMAEVGLFDSNGTRLNASLVAGSNASFLEPGQAAYVYPVTGNNGNNGTIDNLFDCKNLPWQARIAKAPNPSDPETWPTVVMRLADGANPVALWDFAAGNRGDQDSGSGTSSNSYPRACVLMGSVDGIHYDLLGEASVATYTSAYRAWAYIKEQVNYDNSMNHPEAFTLEKTVPSTVYPMPTNALVSVAAGATLRAEGRRPTLSRLKISALGGGTIDGFAFAEHGELHVVDVSNGSVTLPVTFANAEGIANIRNWTLYVNGSATPSKMSIDENGGVLRLLPPGFMLLFR